MIAAVLVAGLMTAAGVLAWMAVTRAVAADRWNRITVLEPVRSRPRRGVPPIVRVGGGAMFAGVAGWVVAGLPGSIAGVVAAAVVPLIARRRRAARSVALVQDQLADAVSTIAACLRAGRSVPQAIAIVSNEVEPPLGPSLHRLADRVELGDPFAVAVGAWAVDSGGPDARLAAGVLQLHRRTGGALAATLEELASTLRRRRSISRELRSLTAQARLSATILGLLPIGFFLFLSAVARQDLQEAYRTNIGGVAIGLGLTLQAAAYLWIRQLLRVEL